MKPAEDGILPTVLLRGRIENLKVERVSYDFVFDATDRGGMAATAVVGAIAGLGGVASGLGAMSQDTSEMADLMTFDLNGRRIRAWVWLSIFHNGDEVEVVAERSADGWQGYGIRRTKDFIVVLHPHCSTGRWGHLKSTIKWWLVLSIPLILLGVAVVGMADVVKGQTNYLIADVIRAMFGGGACCLAVSAFIAARVSYKMMGFVRLSEAIFASFGWKNPSRIDLPRITKKWLDGYKAPVLGLLIFRYDEPSRASDNDPVPPSTSALEACD